MRPRDHDLTRRRMRALQRMAERVCVLILHSDLPRVDVAIEVEKMRDVAERWFPGRGELFEMIYESRFERLWEQFGDERPEPAADPE